VQAEDHVRFTQRSIKRNLCYKFYLIGDNHDSSICGFDHSPIDDGLRNYLRWIAARTPCPRRGACRNLNCLTGHICQKSDCKYRGGKTYCKLPLALHYVQMGVKEFVPGVVPPPFGVPPPLPKKNGSGSYASSCSSAASAASRNSRSGRHSRRRSRIPRRVRRPGKAEVRMPSRSSSGSGSGSGSCSGSDQERPSRLSQERRPAHQARYKCTCCPFMAYTFDSPEALK